MNRDQVVVVTASNDAYFPGLCVTVASAVVSTRSSADLRFHVLDTGLSESKRSLLRRLVESLGGVTELHFHPVTGEAFEGFNTDYGGGYSTYARLLIGDLVPGPRAIYVDADFLVLRDLSEIWSGPIAPAVMLATAEWDTFRDTGHRLSCDCPFLPETEAAAFEYFNCGFLLIDLEAWRSMDLGTQAIRAVREHGVRLKAWDQTVLNYILRGRIGGLPPVWCVACAIDGIPREGNIHYISKRKPWNHWAPMPMYRAWHAFHNIFVKALAPHRMPVRTLAFGTACTLRDAVCARLRPLGDAYVARLRRKAGDTHADCYAQHLDRYRKALANPEWRSSAALRTLEEKWRTSGNR